jgi:hypothetical protein
MWIPKMGVLSSFDEREMPKPCSDQSADLTGIIKPEGESEDA